jgi:DNA-binding Xre family transcriptional regulator
MAKVVRITLKDYLIRLQAADLDKPESVRRKVPTLNELASAIGISRESMSRFANNHRRRIDLDFFVTIADELEKCGWEPQISDFLTLQERSGETRTGVFPA